MRGKMRLLASTAVGLALVPWPHVGFGQNFGNIPPGYVIGNPTAAKAPARPIPGPSVMSTADLGDRNVSDAGGLSVWRIDVPSLYMPVNSACTVGGAGGDGGFQIASADGKCWQLVPPPDYVDPRIWGQIGTVDDTALWQKIDTAMGSAAWPVQSAKVAFVPPGFSPINDWHDTNVSFKGVLDQSFLGCASTCSSSSPAVWYVGKGPFSVEDVGFKNPMFSFTNPAQPIGAWGLLIEGPGTSGVGPFQQVSKVTLRNVHAQGGFDGVGVYNTAQLEVHGFRGDRQFGWGLIISAQNVGTNLPNTVMERINVDDVDCTMPGDYCVSVPIGPFSSTGPSTGYAALQSLEWRFTHMRARGCGFFDAKFCYDFTGTNFGQGVFEASAYNAFSGGMEFKNTIQATASVPGEYSNTNIRMNYSSSYDSGIGVALEHENQVQDRNADTMHSIFAKSEVQWKAPATCQRVFLYIPGDVCTLNGNTYITPSGGLTASSGGPSGQGDYPHVASRPSGPLTTQIGVIAGVDGNAACTGDEWASGDGCGVVWWYLQGTPAVAVQARAPSTTYFASDYVTANGNVYIAQLGGTTGGGGGPSCVSGTCPADGSVIWTFVRVGTTMAWPSSLTGGSIAAMNGVDFDIRVQGTAYGLELIERGGADATLRNANIKVQGQVSTSCVIDSPPVGSYGELYGVVDHIVLDGDCDAGYRGNMGSNALSLGSGNGTTYTVMSNSVLKGRWKSENGIALETINDPNATLGLTLASDAQLIGGNGGIFLQGKTNLGISPGAQIASGNSGFYTIEASGANATGQVTSNGEIFAVSGISPSSSSFLGSGNASGANITFNLPKVTRGTATANPNTINASCNWGDAFNALPSSGNLGYWTCTTPGTPGVWTLH